MLVPDSSNISTIYYIKATGLSTGWTHINLNFVAPSAGYIVGYNCFITVDYWAYVNRIMLAHKCHYSPSGNFMIPVTKGDTFSIDNFWLRTPMTDESCIAIYFFPAKAVKESDL